MMNAKVEDDAGVTDLVEPSQRPPDIGFFKVNTNAALDGMNRRVVTGAIVRARQQWGDYGFMGDISLKDFKKITQRCSFKGLTNIANMINLLI